MVRVQPASCQFSLQHVFRPSLKDFWNTKTRKLARNQPLNGSKADLHDARDLAVRSAGGV